MVLLLKTVLVCIISSMHALAPTAVLTCSQHYYAQCDLLLLSISLRLDTESVKELTNHVMTWHMPCHSKVNPHGVETHKCLHAMHTRARQKYKP